MRLLAIALLLTGCSKIVGIGAVSRGDGGTTDTLSDALVDAPSNTVIGRHYTKYVTASGSTDVPTDLTGTVIRVLIADANQPSGFQVVEGSGKADGTFSISPVPDGVEFIIKLGTFYYVTSRRELDWHATYLMRGQPPPVIANNASTIAFSLTNMQPFTENFGKNLVDSIQINSAGLSYYGIAGNPQSGDVGWMDSYDWLAQGLSIITAGIPLPDTAHGDDIWVLHRRQLVVQGTRDHRAERIVDAFNVSSLALTDGGSVAVPGAFVQVPQNKLLSLFYTKGTFDAGYDSLTQPAGSSVTLNANPAPVDFNIGNVLATIEFNDWSRAHNGMESVSMMYGDPFPTSWARQLHVGYSRIRFALVPGTTTPRSMIGSILRLFTYSGATTGVSAALVPPLNIKIAGQAAATGGMIAFDGTKPITVTWNAVAGAKTYAVAVHRMFANGIQTRNQVTGQITTAATSVTIPAEVFSGSEFFVFTVSASTAPADYASGQLVAGGTPMQFASIPSGMFRLLPSCGNGTPEGSEQCDAMGESTTCDIDCTPRVCGDGMRNTMAGEACDTVRDTEGCDADCTLPMCGDGRRNATVEDCDDGNASDDGNGCSAVCKWNNQCGDGVAQLIVEECDTNGDTMSCDSDCTAAECGDGHHNSFAMEQCDDGNFSDDDGCTTQCMTN